MKKVTALSIVIAMILLAVAVKADAQQEKKIPRIGFLASGSPTSMSSRIEAFRLGLRDLDYREGHNIVVEFRYAEGNPARFADFAAELVGLKPDVIVTSSGSGALAAKKATRTTSTATLPFSSPRS